MERDQMVNVTEERTIQRSTVAGLLEAFAAAFSSPYKVERLLYERGSTVFTVDRRVPAGKTGDRTADDGIVALLTPFQMIRQHADLEDAESDGAESAIETVARAVQSLTSRGHKLTMFVCPNRTMVREWLEKGIRVEDVWQVPLLEDADIRGSHFFVVGSKAGPSLRDVEAAVCCQMRA